MSLTNGFFIGINMFEWDEAKRHRNLAKHGVDFMLVYEGEWNLIVLRHDERKNYGEERLIAYVPIHDRIHVCIYTMRSNMMRVISLRKANDREVDFYETQMDSTNT